MDAESTPRQHWEPHRLASFVARFLDAAIPLEEWAPHTSHLAVSTVICRRHPADALQRMRAGIKALNAANNVVGRYHETVTRFYVERIVELLGRSDRGQSDAELVNEVIAALGGSRERREGIWRRYYLDEGFPWNHPTARDVWVGPDLDGSRSGRPGST